jgi:hypothetical protein
MKTGWLVLGCVILMAVTWQGYFHAYEANGELRMTYPPLLDPQTGEPVPDLEAEPIYMQHPITGEPLQDASGHRILDPAAQPMLRDLDRGEPVKVSIAWPWYAPIGGFTALVFGYLLADRRLGASAPHKDATSPEGEDA